MHPVCIADNGKSRTIQSRRQRAAHPHGGGRNRKSPAPRQDHRFLQGIECSLLSVTYTGFAQKLRKPLLQSPFTREPSFVLAHDCTGRSIQYARLHKRAGSRRQIFPKIVLCNATLEVKRTIGRGSCTGK